MLYDTILHCSNECISWTVLDHLNTVFLNPECLPETRALILQQLSKVLTIWDNPDVLIQNWFYPSICDNKDSLSSFLTIANHVISKDYSQAKVIVQLFTPEIEPFPRDTVCIELIFQYFCTLVKTTGLSAEMFGDEQFIHSIIETKPAFEVALYVIGFQDVQDLLALLLNRNRRNWQTKSLCKKLLEMLPYDKDSILFNLLYPIFYSELTPVLIHSFLLFIEEKSIFDIASNLINICDNFSQIVENNKNDIFSDLPYDKPQFLESFLSFMKLYILHFRSHAFDDWILEQNYETCPVFKADYDIIQKFMPSTILQEEEELLFPALFSLFFSNLSQNHMNDINDCEHQLTSQKPENEIQDKQENKSMPKTNLHPVLQQFFKPVKDGKISLLINVYLMAYYQIPMMKKMNVKISYHPMISAISSVFVRKIDALDLIKEDLCSSVGFFAVLPQPSSIYELSPQSPESALLFPNTISSIIFTVDGILIVAFSFVSM